MQDVIVTITRETLPTTQAGFGLPLILSPNGAHPYTEYESLAEVAADFAAGDDGYEDESPEHAMARAIFAQTPRVPKLAIAGVAYQSGVDPVTVLTDALDTLVETHNDWYFLLCPEQGDAEAAAVSEWTDDKRKLYFVATDNFDLAGELDSDRTVVIYHDQPGSYPDAAWVGRCAPENPGSITWKFKALTGIEASDITPAQLIALHDDGGNSYVAKMGRLQTSEGLTTSGEYIDVIRGADWLESRIATRVQRLLTTAPKVPYDNRGIAQVLAELEAALQEAVAANVIAVDNAGNGLWTTSAPDRADVPAESRARRILPDVRFTATLAGAVHEVRIDGVLQI